jgi:hypothetical protein
MIAGRLKRAIIPEAMLEKLAHHPLIIPVFN